MTLIEVTSVSLRVSLVLVFLCLLDAQRNHMKMEKGASDKRRRAVRAVLLCCAVVLTSQAAAGEQSCSVYGSEDVYSV